MVSISFKPSSNRMVAVHSLLAQLADSIGQVRALEVELSTARTTAASLLDFFVCG